MLRDQIPEWERRKNALINGLAKALAKALG
jgi:hypothetical protein